MTDPELATQRFMQRLSAGQKARRMRLQLLIVGTVSTITLAVATGGWALTSYVSANLGRVNAGTSGTPASGPVNILLAGVDTRGGLTRKQERRLHVGDAISTNTDTLMLVHIPANHDSIQVVSLPRDTWIDIPGHGMNKINAAFGIGGPPLMVRTVERATGLTINDYVEVNFLGFVQVVNALGGVNICVPFAVNDHDSGLHLTAGRHHVNGVTALEFARDRHSFPQSDIARISDQQQLLSSMFAEATQTGVLADPIRLQRFLSSVTASVTVDKGFNLIRLATELRGIRSQDISFTTMPLASVNYATPTGESAVLWNKTAAEALFARLKADTGLPKPRTRAHRHSPTRSHKPAGITRAQVSIDVYNGTTIGKLSATTGTKLAALGFTVHKAGLNWRQHNLKRTLIEYPPGQAAAADLLRASLPGATVRAVSGLTRIRLVLGGSGHTVTGSPPAGKTTPSPAASQSIAPGQIAPSGQQRTAAQDACR